MTDGRPASEPPEGFRTSHDGVARAKPSAPPRAPRWAWLLFPHLFLLIAASALAAAGRLPTVVLRGGLDKLGHFLLLGTLSLLAVGFVGRARWLRVVAVLGALSALEEASQAWFPARTVDVWDLTANLLGITFGAGLATRLTRAS